MNYTPKSVGPIVCEIELLKKSFWSNVRSAIDKEVEWIDERVTGGDRLREEWRQKCRREKEAGATDNPLNDF